MKKEENTMDTMTASCKTANKKINKRAALLNSGLSTERKKSLGLNYASKRTSSAEKDCGDGVAIAQPRIQEAKMDRKTKPSTKLVPPLRKHSKDNLGDGSSKFPADGIKVKKQGMDQAMVLSPYIRLAQRVRKCKALYYAPSYRNMMISAKKGTLNNPKTGFVTLQTYWINPDSNNADTVETNYCDTVKVVEEKPVPTRDTKRRYKVISTSHNVNKINCDDNNPEQGASTSSNDGAKDENILKRDEDECLQEKSAFTRKGRQPQQQKLTSQKVNAINRIRGKIVKRSEGKAVVMPNLFATKRGSHQRKAKLMAYNCYRTSCKNETIGDNDQYKVVKPNLFSTNCRHYQSKAKHASYNSNVISNSEEEMMDKDEDEAVITQPFATKRRTYQRKAMLKSCTANIVSSSEEDCNNKDEANNVTQKLYVVNRPGLHRKTKFQSNNVNTIDSSEESKEKNEDNVVVPTPVPAKRRRYHRKAKVYTLMTRSTYNSAIAKNERTPLNHDALIRQSNRRNPASAAFTLNKTSSTNYGFEEADEDYTLHPFNTKLKSHQHEASSTSGYINKISSSNARNLINPDDDTSTLEDVSISKVTEENVDNNTYGEAAKTLIATKSRQFKNKEVTEDVTAQNGPKPDKDSPTFDDNCTVDDTKKNLDMNTPDVTSKNSVATEEIQCKHKELSDNVYELSSTNEKIADWESVSFVARKTVVTTEMNCRKSTCKYYNVNKMANERVVIVPGASPKTLENDCTGVNTVQTTDINTVKLIAGSPIFKRTRKRVPKSPLPSQYMNMTKCTSEKVDTKYKYKDAPAKPVPTKSRKRQHQSTISSNDTSKMGRMQDYNNTDGDEDITETQPSTLQPRDMYVVNAIHIFDTKYPREGKAYLARNYSDIATISVNTRNIDTVHNSQNAAAIWKSLNQTPSSTCDAFILNSTPKSGPKHLNGSKSYLKDDNTDNTDVKPTCTKTLCDNVVGNSVQIRAKLFLPYYLTKRIMKMLSEVNQILMPKAMSARVVNIPCESVSDLEDELVYVSIKGDGSIHVETIQPAADQVPDNETEGSSSLQDNIDDGTTNVETLDNVVFNVKAVVVHNDSVDNTADQYTNKNTSGNEKDTSILVLITAIPREENIQQETTLTPNSVVEITSINPHETPFPRKDDCTDIGSVELPLDIQSASGADHVKEDALTKSPRLRKRKAQETHNGTTICYTPVRGINYLDKSNFCLQDDNVNVESVINYEPDATVISPPVKRKRWTQARRKSVSSKISIDRLASPISTKSNREQNALAHYLALMNFNLRQANTQAYLFDSRNDQIPKSSVTANSKLVVHIHSLPEVYRTGYEQQSDTGFRGQSSLRYEQNGPTFSTQKRKPTILFNRLTASCIDIDTARKSLSNTMRTDIVTLKEGRTETVNSPYLNSAYDAAFDIYLNNDEGSTTADMLCNNVQLTYFETDFVHTIDVDAIAFQELKIANSTRPRSTPLDNLSAAIAMLETIEQNLGKVGCSQVEPDNLHIVNSISTKNNTLKSGIKRKAMVTARASTKRVKALAERVNSRDMANNSSLMDTALENDAKYSEMLDKAEHGLETPSAPTKRLERVAESVNDTDIPKNSYSNEGRLKNGDKYSEILNRGIIVP